MSTNYTETPIEVVWEGGMRYRGGHAGGPKMLLDGRKEDAPSPVESLLVALAACSAIDVVEILEKRRARPSELSVRMDYSRAEQPPRRLVAMRAIFRVNTEAEKHHVERAVALSFEKYCSVATSLSPDIPLEWSVELNQQDDLPSE